VTHSSTALTYRTVALDEGEIFYREAGHVSAPSLLLVHDRLMARLRASLHVVAPDLPGFGRSPAPAGTMTFDRLTDTVDRFTDAVGLEHFSLYAFGKPGPS
jgi:pimeloyl-ACP methyl ester carboxylesterase